MLSNPMKNFDELRLWFEEMRNSLIYLPLEEIKVKVVNENFNEHIQVFTLGSFDEKIIITYIDDTIECLVCSVDKPIAETIFFNKYIKMFKEEKTYDFTAHLFLEIDFIKKLYSPKIALLSLAKNDVYTFPRFALGISDIAHAIRKNFNGSVKLYDLQLNPDIDDFINSVKNENIDIVGISMTFGLFDVLESVLDALQKESLKCLITVGGSLAGITFKEILAKYPDVVVSLSEGETFFVKLIDHFQGNCELKDIPAIAFVDKSTNSICQTSFCKFSRDAELSIPELDLLIPTIKSKGVFQLETSRGCYNACSFCPRRQKGIWRGSTKDVEKVGTLINHFCHYLKRLNYDPSKFIMYVVDEEFVGGENEHYQDRAVEVSRIFARNNLKYETSFRMNTIYSSHTSEEAKLRKIKNMIKLRDNNLNRVLVGVESGVQSVLERFNKNVTSEENTLGIRLLTGLAVPTRFTYITFDPLMNFDELKETYFFQGRKDLILKTNYKNEPEKLLYAVKNKDEILKLSKGIPFYSQIPYMLVSIECLIGSAYLNMAMEHDLATNQIIKAIGKQEVNYVDKRIGKMSYYSQLWIDRNFALDYSLKSLAKIYLGEASLNIREQRVLLKQNAYKLLGKMLYVIEQNKKFLFDESIDNIEFVDTLSKQYDSVDSLDKVFKNLLEHQFSLLKDEIHKLKFNLKSNISQKDYENICKQLEGWTNQKEWHLLHSA